MTLAQTAYEELRWDIISGVLRPCQPLRLEQLKSRYNIGFSPLREALNRLHSERLVSSVALKGFNVASLSLSDMWDAIDTRILIETDALKRAIEYGDDEWETKIVANFHALTLQMKRNENRKLNNEKIDWRSMENRHRAFHTSLISACRSNWLLDFAEKLVVETERYRFPSLSRLQNFPDSRDIEHEHKEIMAFTINRETAKAVDLLTHHYQTTGRFLEEQFKDNIEIELNT
ncbi:MAG: FCD domain-containing protein [Rhizobiaceae bacterium]